MSKTKINIVMCGSDLSVKGGMVTVVKNYLGYRNWDEFRISYIPTHIEKGKAYGVFYFAKAYLHIMLLLVMGKVDIAYLHTSERGSVYRKIIIAKTAKMFGVPVVLHHHGAEFEKFYSGLSESKKSFVNKGLGNVDANVVLSKLLVNMIISKVPKAKVFTLYNSVPVDTNHYNSDGDRILFLGRLGERKGTYDLIEAISKLNNRIEPQYKFLLCGDGDIDKVKETIKNKGLSDRVSFVGWIDKVQKDEFYKRVVLNVLPSYNEGLPMTILETMSYGIPNISTNIASIPEVIEDEINGYLIKPGDVESLANRIEKLCRNRSLRVQFSEAAYAKIYNTFSMDVNIAKLKELLRRLVDKRCKE